MRDYRPWFRSSLGTNALTTRGPWKPLYVRRSCQIPRRCSELHWASPMPCSTSTQWGSITATWNAITWCWCQDSSCHISETQKLKSSTLGGPLKWAIPQNLSAFDRRGRESCSEGPPRSLQRWWKEGCRTASIRRYTHWEWYSARCREIDSNI